MRGAGPLLLALATACAPGDGPSVEDSDGSGGATETGAGSTGAATDTTGPELDGTPGCDAAVFRTLPEDPGVRGPWPVGARTVEVDALTVEVWYPALPGSEAGVPTVRYDIREQLPESERTKISDADNPWQDCACHRDLAPDLEYGPYPVIVFVHGTAGYRTQSLPQMVHWASRGFVVLAADHPGLKLGDLLSTVCGGPSVARTLPEDVAQMVAAARGELGGLEFLGEAIDGSRVGLTGHSAGGSTVGSLPASGQVIVPMAAGGVMEGGIVESVLILGGTADSVVPYARQVEGYEASPEPKRLVGLADAGHLAFAQLCSLRNAAGDDLLTIAVDNEVCGAELAGGLFQCSPDLLPDPQAWAIVDYATAAVFEETLHCRDASAAFAELEARFAAVFEYRSSQ
jgi:dienelactone hydrolase